MAGTIVDPFPETSDATPILRPVVASGGDVATHRGEGHMDGKAAAGRRTENPSEVPGT